MMGCFMSDLEGAMLSDYLLLQCISKGGMADVYRAHQVGEGNYEVAVKVFRSNYAQRQSFRDYFMTEAEKIGQFDHPNILPFLEFGEGENLLYVVTPFVPTGTLEDLLRRVGGKFPAMQAFPIMQQLCSAVQYAHNHDVIHGNIKPSNVFVAADGRMLLSDFGIAHGYDDSQQSLTRVGWGSAEYAAPEQSLGVLRRSSDIYTLGVLLFRILTGHPPFTGQTPVEVLLKHVRQQPPSARVFVPNISDAVDGVLLMAMQKRSDDRFASAEEFGNAFLVAVTIAPTASPVAKSVPMVTSQPALNQQSSPGIGDPQTPFPAAVAFTPPVETSLPAATELSPSAPPVEKPVQPSPPPVTLPFAGEPGSDVTDVRKKNPSEEGKGNGAGKHKFWSVDPVEWSPIESDAGAKEGSVALTASEYLSNKSVVPGESSPSPAPSSPTPEALPASPPEKKTPDKENGHDKLSSRLNKLLPVVVVILLLLGLLGALLSSFLFSPQPSGSPAGQASSSTNSSAGVTGTATSPTQKGTGTANATRTPVTTPTAARPTLTPTPVRIVPPVPAFSCTSGTLALDGSANLEPAILQLTTDYNNQCSNSGNFTVTADGSKGGLDAVVSGSSDLAYSDLTSANRPALMDYPVAALIYSVVVNVDTQVTKLTTAQLQDIYTGKVTNWSQVGGTDEPVVIITRPADSAIRAIFEAYVLKGVKQSVDGVSLWSDSNDGVAQKVLYTSGGISYVPLAAAPINGAQSVAIDGISPTARAVENGTYPFWSIEHLYSNHAATGLALSFISFGFTSTGTNDLTNYDAVPVKLIPRAVLSSHLPGPTV